MPASANTDASIQGMGICRVAEPYFKQYCQAEKKMVPSSSGMNENVNTLLQKYSNNINYATLGYDVDYPFYLMRLQL
ncbi:22739_t:CDS:2 [Rhizophagus irregularis]|nr:22739_t:CDS:2 [Rhizophagus irregularis]